MEITLQPSEVELLKQVVSNYFSDLRLEIGDTDDHDYREGLKANEVIIRNIIAKLETTGVPKS